MTNGNKDYRIKYLLQNCNEEPFYITGIDEKGMITFSNKKGMDLAIRAKIPRKIISYDGETEIYVTKKKFMLKNKPAPTPIGDPEDG